MNVCPVARPAERFATYFSLAYSTEQVKLSLMRRARVAIL